MYDKELYGEDFHKKRDEETSHSAEVILNILKDYLDIESVCDVGCGVGTWLAHCGTESILGIDGEYKEGMMKIPGDCFRVADLARPIEGDIGRYDLCISLEVAEHLPKNRAESFVKDLCNISDNVLFSAAFIGQNGVGHINENTIHYWRRIFKKNGYKMIDCVRPFIYEDKSIPAWYRRNIVLFVKSDRIAERLSKFENKRISYSIDIEKVMASIKKRIKRNRHA